MSVTVTRTVSNGDGTYTFYGVSPAGNAVHVVAGQDRLEDGSVYTMLEVAARKADSRASALQRQSTMDSEADASGD